MNTAMQKEVLSLSRCVEDYYWNNLQKLKSPDKVVHYFSRLYLWSGKLEYYKHYTPIKKLYLHHLNDVSLFVRQTLKNTTITAADIKNPKKHFRLEYADVYGEITAYNKIFLNILLLRSVFDHDVSNEASSLLNFVHINSLREKLLNDPRSIFILSTRAINFLYLSQKLFEASIDHRLSPERLLSISQNYQAPTLETTLLSRIYLLTHCIIGASSFYSTPIESDLVVYREMLREIERSIQKDYSIILLDQKCEFLVCCRMLNYQSKIENIIYDEVLQSASPEGSFIVDTINQTTRSIKQDFNQSEHRNVLFIMSTKKYAHTRS